MLKIVCSLPETRHKLNSTFRARLFIEKLVVRTDEGSLFNSVPIVSGSKRYYVFVWLWLHALPALVTLRSCNSLSFHSAWKLHINARVLVFRRQHTAGCKWQCENSDQLRSIPTRSSAVLCFTDQRGHWRVFVPDRNRDGAPIAVPRAIRTVSSQCTRQQFPSRTSWSRHIWWRWPCVVLEMWQWRNIHGEYSYYGN